jgi:hypothetical protein
MGVCTEIGAVHFCQCLAWRQTGSMAVHPYLRISMVLKCDLACSVLFQFGPGYEFGFFGELIRRELMTLGSSD